MENNQKIRWIDALKFVAILAVMVDHCVGVLYSDNLIKIGSFFSAAVFVFLGGVTSFYSCRRHKNEPYLKITLKRELNIFIPYAIATLAYLIAKYHFFNFVEYIQYLARFNISGPFYFVIFYMQLIAIAPILYALIDFASHKARLIDIIALAVVGCLAISYFSIKYTLIIDSYGGGRYLLGGTYLFIYCMGMIAGFVLLINTHVRNAGHMRLVKTVPAIIYTIGAFIFIIHDNFKTDSLLPFGNGINPPSISIIAYSLGIIWCGYEIFTWLDNLQIKPIKMLYNGMCYLGSNSLYIFLYHRLFLDFVLCKFDIGNYWAKRAVYFVVMIAGSIAIHLMVGKVKNIFKIVILQSRGGA